jgi:hypothetical protein
MPEAQPGGGVSPQVHVSDCTKANVTGDGNVPAGVTHNPAQSALAPKGGDAMFSRHKFDADGQPTSSQPHRWEAVAGLGRIISFLAALFGPSVALAQSVTGDQLGAYSCGRVYAGKVHSDRYGKLQLFFFRSG